MGWQGQVGLLEGQSNSSCLSAGHRPVAGQLLSLEGEAGDSSNVSSPRALDSQPCSLSTCCSLDLECPPKPCVPRLGHRPVVAEPLGCGA